MRKQTEMCLFLRRVTAGVVAPFCCELMVVVMVVTLMLASAWDLYVPEEAGLGPEPRGLCAAF